MEKSNEKPREEYGHWQASKRIYLEGIDKNKMLPPHYKEQLKELVVKQFEVIGAMVTNFELLYLRDTQHQK